jgi:hypothetical protein
MKEKAEKERTKELYRKAARNTFLIIDSIDQELSEADSMRRKKRTSSENQSK